MSNPFDPIVYADDAERIVGVMDSLMPLLPPDVARRFNDIKVAILRESGIRGVYDRLNGRRISEIVANEACQLPNPIASGERDGVVFRLYSAKHEGREAEGGGGEPAT